MEIYACSLYVCELNNHDDNESADVVWPYLQIKKEEITFYDHLFFFSFGAKINLTTYFLHDYVIKTILI